MRSINVGICQNSMKQRLIQEFTESTGLSKKEAEKAWDELVSFGLIVSMGQEQIGLRKV